MTRRKGAYRIGELVEQWGVSQQYIRRMIAQGEIESIKLPGSPNNAPRLIPAASWHSFLARHKEMSRKS